MIYNRFFIYFIKVFIYTLHKFILSFYTNALEHLASKFTEEALNKIKSGVPGKMILIP